MMVEVELNITGVMILMKDLKYRLAESERKMKMCKNCKCSRWEPRNQPCEKCERNPKYVDYFEMYDPLENEI